MGKNKGKRNVYIVGGIIIFLMVTSLFGLFTHDTTASSKEYNGYTFYQSSHQGWFTRINGQAIPFGYLPDTVDHIEIPTEIRTNEEKIYIVDEANNGYAMERLKQFILQFSNARIVDACFTEEDCLGDLPIITCEDASAQVLHFKNLEGDDANSIEEKTTAEVNGQCVTIATNQMELVVEHLAYKILGILP